MLAWLVVAFGIFLIGLTKSGFGSGIGLLNVPLIVLAMGYTGRGSEAALGLMLPLLIAGDLIAVWQYRKLFVGQSQDEPWQGSVAPPTGPQLVRQLIPGTIAGVILGGGLLWWFHQHEHLVSALIRTEIGIECILLVGLHWWRQYKGLQSYLMPEPWRSHLTGTFAGISSTLAHAAGPIIAMYLLPMKLDRRLFVGTCAIYFFLLNTAKLPAYYASGLFSQVSPAFSLQFLPLVLIGAVVGFWLNQRMSDRLFSGIVYGTTFLLGWYLLADGVWTLVRVLAGQGQMH